MKLFCYKFLQNYVRFEVFTAETLKKAVFWEMLTDVSEERITSMEGISSSELDKILTDNNRNVRTFNGQ
jgi:hypothetical protein